MATTAYAAPSATEPTTHPREHVAAMRVGGTLIAAGLAFVFLALDAPAALARLYDLVASRGTVTTMDMSARFGAALFGALTFGWGVTLFQLGRGRALASAIATGTLAWFVVDSAASIASGYAWNTVSNLGFVAVILILLRTGRR